MIGRCRVVRPDLHVVIMLKAVSLSVLFFLSLGVLFAAYASVPV